MVERIKNTAPPWAKGILFTVDKELSFIFLIGTDHYIEKIMHIFVIKNK